jgi:uncharacterized protein YydD (DUF2326 family)
MFLKKLIIKHADGTIIREIPFSLGLNLVIDETPTENGRETGNNVGKTTVLKLIDFCLGASAKGIYVDLHLKLTHRGCGQNLGLVYVVKPKRSRYSMGLR